jgi:hypothetical protein
MEKMTKIRRLTMFFTVIGALFSLFIYDTLPDNIFFKEILTSQTQEDVVIVFNSGGWGDTPPESAEDLTPIIEGVKATLAEKGYTSVVVPYERTKKGFLAKIRGAKEMFSYFQKQSSEVSSNIKIFLEKNPDKKVVLVGLSNGANFVDETMKKINDFRGSVLAIEIGSPFWQKKMPSENILRIDNGNNDSLTKGEVGTLLPTLLKGPAKWFLAKISGSDLSFSMAFSFPQHKYSWESPEVNSAVASFLEKEMTGRD